MRAPVTPLLLRLLGFATFTPYTLSLGIEELLIYMKQYPAKEVHPLAAGFLIFVYLLFRHDPTTDALEPLTMQTFPHILTLADADALFMDYAADCSKYNDWGDLSFLRTFV